MNHQKRSVSEILSPALAAVALSVLIAACTPTADSNSESSASSSSSAPSVTQGSSAMSTSSVMTASSAAMATSSVAATDHDYKDGTYSADGIYRSPAGAEEIDVTLTLQDDVIVSANVVGTATNPKSKAMQAAFNEGYSTMVVGKSIDELSLGVVNGSSLTPKGFMDAVEKIKVQAAAS